MRELLGLKSIEQTGRLEVQVRIDIDVAVLSSNFAEQQAGN